MNDPSIDLSGITVIVRPECFGAARRAIAKLPGVEVAAADASTGRLAVIQELPTPGAHAEGLRRIQAVPGVLYAGLICHYHEPGGGAEDLVAPRSGHAKEV